MRIVAAISYYDEPPDWLHRAAHTALTLCDHVVALDGRYKRFPDERIHKQADERSALANAGRCVSIYEGAPKVYETQCAKRSHLFKLAAKHAGKDGVVLVLDADEAVECEPDHARHLLERDSEVQVWTVWTGGPEPEWYTHKDRKLQRSDYVGRSGPNHRRLFRVSRDLGMAAGTHSVVVGTHPHTSEIVALKGSKSHFRRIEPELVGTASQHVRLPHYGLERPWDRRVAKADYYDTRKEAGEDV